MRPGFLFFGRAFLVLTLLFSDTRKIVLQQIQKFWPAFVGGAAVFALGLVPFLRAYLPVLRVSGGREYESSLPLIPLPVSFLLTSQRNYLWGSVSTAS